MKKTIIQRIKAAAVLATAVFVGAGCSAGSPAQTSEPPVTAAISADTADSGTITETAPEEPVTEETERKPNTVRTAEELAGKKVIAFTFDDGPNTGVTNEILDVAEQYGIKFSFFVIGQNINDETASAMQRAHSLGCEINSHSFTHSDMTKLSADEIKDEMDRTAELIYSYVGEYPKFFRPPYISVSPELYAAIDLPFISGIGCNDWEDKVSVEKRVRFLTEKCPDGVIVLLHDQATNEKTAEAVRQAVPMLLEQGFEFVTCSELFAAKGITPSPDSEIIYSYATESGWK
ncbi:MAG: polysaccharide deacetylase family protein [Ruminiclostridium sp.]|nr:polysaccharide deacetylase family protein [Ruminiclostridium sp.]